MPYGLLLMKRSRQITTRLYLLRAILICILLSGFAAQIRAEEEVKNSEVETKPAEEQLSGIRVRHAEIRGRVLLAKQTEGEEEVPGIGVTVKITDVDDKELICKTVTDEEGFYEFPKIEVAHYHIYIGDLAMSLIVEPATKADEDERPKILIVVIPEEMAK